MIQFAVTVTCILNSSCPMAAPYHAMFKAENAKQCEQRIKKIVNALGYDTKQFHVKCESK